MEEMPSSQEIKKVVKEKNWLAFSAFLLSVAAIMISLLLSGNLKKQWYLMQENQVRIATASVSYGEVIQFLQNQLHEQEIKVATLNETLARLSQMMSSMEGGVLVQVEYLAQLAQLNLKYQADITGALSLLKMADQRLATLSLPSILEVRHVLAKNISQLEAVPPVDLSGVLVRLDVLSDQVMQLPLVPELPRTQPTLKQPKSTTKLDTYLTNWKDALSTSWHALERVVIIRHHGQPIEPLLSSEEYLYLKQNIQLQLEKAQWAALHQQQAIYLKSLQNAAGWINHYFTDNGLLSRAIQHDLAELEKVVIQPVVPDISASLNAIQQMRKQIEMNNKTPLVIVDKVVPAANKTIVPMATPPAVITPSTVKVS